MRIAPAASQASWAEEAWDFLLVWSFRTTTRCGGGDAVQILSVDKGGFNGLTRRMYPVQTRRGVIATQREHQSSRTSRG